ncbi:hypothetical protein D0Z03_000479 [Geotrichum reessii]|nr:hypothetical protein D0Z03_000479 [Galactomyces reessii]
MKFSQLAVSAFLASSAFAIPVADPDVVTVIETAQDVDYVTAVQNVYVTVVAGQESSVAPVPSPDTAAANQGQDVVTVTADPSAASPTSNGDVAYVEATVYVDQNGNPVTPNVNSPAPASSTISPLSFYTYRHTHSSVESSVEPAPTSSSTSNDAVVTTSVIADSVSDSTPVTSTIEEAPTPTTSTVEEISTSTPSPTQDSQTENVQDSAAAVSDSSSSQLDSFASGCTDLHNSLRAKHSAPPLTWNSTLADYAKNYLSNQNCVFAHSGGPYGENLAIGYPSAENAIQGWYDEIKDYDFSSGQFSMSTGHFTQVVWKDTTQVGCHLYDCGSGRGGFLACEYYPAGNIIGYFLENVIA